MPAGLIIISAMACKKELVTSFKAQRTFSTKICAVKPLVPVGLEKIYGCTNTLYALRTAFADSFRVVRHQAAFDSLLSGGCRPAVDFIQYDLLAGPRQLISGIDSVSYSLQHNCPDSRYEVWLLFYFMVRGKVKSFLSGQKPARQVLWAKKSAKAAAKRIREPLTSSVLLCLCMAILQCLWPNLQNPLPKRRSFLLH